MRKLFAVGLLLPAALAGCVDCDPQEVPATVTLTRLAEEVRTLPILSSGATSVGAVRVPDSHGRLEIRVAISHNLSSVEIDDLSLTVTVGGQNVPVRILEIDGGRDFASADGNTWEGGVHAGGKLVLWWAVDRNQVAAASALLLAEGAPYTATVAFTWRHHSCTHRAQGTVEQAFSDFVQASVNARSFSLVGEPQLEQTVTGVGLRANFTVKSGLEANVTAASARAVLVGTGPAGGLALITFPSIRWTVDGEPVDEVKPGQTLRAFSAAFGPGKARYGTSGTAAGVVPGSGLALLLIDLAYLPKDPTPGTPRDEFAHGRALAGG